MSKAGDLGRSMPNLALNILVKNKRNGEIKISFTRNALIDNGIIKAMDNM